MTVATSANIASHLTSMSDQLPDSPAIMFVTGKDEQGVRRYGRCSYRELEDDSNAIAAGLASIGITPGMRTALCLKPGVDFFATTFALFKMGAIPVFVDPGIGMRNFGKCLSEAKPEAFIGIPAAHAARKMLGWAKKSARLFVTTGKIGGTTLDRIREIGRGASIPTYGGDDTAAILFTSGSTGAPKGVEYSHENFSAQVQALKTVYGIQPGELDLATFPLFGLFGPALGMTTVIPQMDFTRPGSVEPWNIIEPIWQLQITSLFGSPALIHRVGEWGRRQGLMLPSLRRVISAGAPVPASTLEVFSRMLSQGVQIFTPYGATESLPVCSIGSREILTETRSATEEGRGVCVGRPAGEMEVRVIRISDDSIAEWSDDLLVPVGVIGEIVVRGPVVTRAYAEREEATRLSKIKDRKGGFWHRMGDVGKLDETGRLWFCGRKSQRVRTATGDIFSMPVEGVFNAHPAVFRSALVWVGEVGKQQPVVCIELQSGRRISRKKLFSDLKVMAEAHESTRGIGHFVVHRRFPVDIRHNAKIGREKLAAWAARKIR